MVISGLMHFLCVLQHTIIPRGSLSLKVLAELPIIVVLMYQVRGYKNTHSVLTLCQLSFFLKGHVPHLDIWLLYKRACQSSETHTL